MEIQNKIDMQLNKFENLLGDLPFEDQDYYSMWLAQTFYFVEHSVPLLREALKGDLNETVNKVFQEHIIEEDGHDSLAVKDLEKHAGLDISTLPKLQETTELYSHAYQGVKSSPASLIGYILALEFLASKFALDIRDRVTEAHGTNKAKFLHVHGTEDQHHTKYMLSLVDSCSEEEKQSILKLLDETFDNYMKIINSIGSHVQVGNA